MNKEEIYDSLISPLMDKIISICKEHKIAMLADFAIPTEHDDGLKCTTALLGSDCNPPKEMLSAIKILKPPDVRLKTFMITTTKPDGSKIVEAVIG